MNDANETLDFPSDTSSLSSLATSHLKTREKHKKRVKIVLKPKKGQPFSKLRNEVLARMRLQHRNISKMLSYKLMREGFLCAKTYYYKTYFESQADRTFKNEFGLLRSYRATSSQELLETALQLLSAVHYLFFNEKTHKRISLTTVERKDNTIVLKYFFD